MTLKFDLEYSIPKSYPKYQLNMSKHEGENCGKLYISRIQNSKKGHNSKKTDKNGQHYYYVHKEKVTYKIHLNMSKHEGEKCGKLWLTDGDPDGRTNITMS